MNLPDLAIINFSDTSDQEAQDAIRAVNRQVEEDFLPIWGSGYACKLHAPAFQEDQPDVLEAERIPAEAVIYLVDRAHITGALGYHSINAAEVPVGFVFTDLGDWTVTLSHEVLELIVDPTVNIFVPGSDPRDTDNPNAWLWHTYEVCDAVERTEYRIDGVSLSNFVTPAYFSSGDSPGTRNDFLGAGVPSFGLLPGCHLGTVDPADLQWVTILGSESEGAQSKQMIEFGRTGIRARAGVEEDACMHDWKTKHPSHANALRELTSLTRSGRKETAMKKLLGYPNSK